MGIFSTANQNAVQKQLDAILAAAATSATLSADVSSLFPDTDTDHPCTFVVDRVDANGNLTPTKREYITFTGVSTTTLTGLTRNADGSGSDQEHAVGAIVEFVPDVLWAKSMVDNFADTSTAQTFTNKTLTLPKINENVALTSSATELNLLDGVTSLPTKATAANVATGTSDTTYTTPKAIRDAGINVTKIIGIQVFDAADSTATGDAKAFYRIPVELNGMNLTGVAATVYTAGTTNTTDVQIRNKTDSADMLSTKITIDSTETDTSTAATPAVIDTTKDDVVTGDVIAIDVDAVSTTAAKGLYVELRFALP
jgi:hypothetical protein